tara:strand:- start:283 stop:1002 length:720 start_codon:yes stop_codon:yes gene_type:complete
MSSVIKVGKVQSSTGQDAVTVADSGAITANGGIANAGTISAGTLGSSVVVPASVGSSMVLIAKVTASASASIEFKHGVGGVVMDNTYGNYIFQMTQILPASDNKHFYCNTMRGNTVSTTCRTIMNRIATDKYTTGSTNVAPAANYDTTGLFACDNVTNDTGHKLLGVSGTITIPNPSATNVYKAGSGQFVYVRDGDYMDCVSFSGIDTVALTAVDGLKFNFHSGNIASGTISMYGLKDA